MNFAQVRAIMRNTEEPKNMRTDPNTVSPHPCKTWYNWSGKNGKLKTYDKELGEDQLIDLPFELILLDKLSTIRGWHDASESGLYSNEVRSTVNEPFTVRAFKQKEPIATGFYQDIKDKVKAAGGRFNTNLYAASPDESGELQIVSLMLHGAALRSWMDFSNDKEVRGLLYKKAIRITKFKEGKKGGVTFRYPIFELVELPEGVDERASELQKELSRHLTKYFGRAKAQAEVVEDEIPMSHDSDETETPF